MGNKSSKKLNEVINVDTIINGYIRYMQKHFTNIIIPSEINSLIIKFYPQLIWMESNHEYITVDGKDTPIKVCGAFKDEFINSGHISLNTYFDASDDEIVTIEMVMTKTSPRYQGFGFCTKQFRDWTPRYWNDGDNGSVVLYQHGYCPKSVGFVCDVDSNYWTNNEYHRMWEMGDTVIVEMNMKEQKGRIWNKNKPDRIFVIGLPYQCTFLLMMGNTEQTITITNIQIQKVR